VHHYSTEDAEVANITLSGSRQQQGLSLLHHLEAILGHQQQRSSCRSTPPVLPGGSNSSSNCCTPTPGRRSCSALELAAIAEGYLQSPLSPAAAAPAAARSPATWHPSTLAVNSSINSKHQQQQQQQQQAQQVQHASDGTSPQPAHSNVSAALLPPRVQISSKDLKQRLLVEPPSSMQLLPHTQGRSATLLSAVHDSAGMLDLEPETPKPLNPAAQAASGHTGNVPVSPGAARLAAVGLHETCTAAAAAAAAGSAARSVNPQDWSADAAAGAEADMHRHSPLVVVLPPAANQPSSHGTKRWRVAVAELTVAAAQPGSTYSNLASPGSAGLGNDRGRPMHDGKGRLRGTLAAGSVDPSAGAAVVSCKLQQQRSRSSSVTSSRGRQGRRGACRSLSRGPLAAAAADTRNCSSSCDMHSVHNTTSRAQPASGDPGSNRGSEGGARRSSGGGCGRAREPAGPLELDPCAPPLGRSKLSQPDLADVDYIVHRWSHRWVQHCFHSNMRQMFCVISQRFAHRMPCRGRRAVLVSMTCCLMYYAGRQPRQRYARA
jgi:hypothetical protein